MNRLSLSKLVPVIVTFFIAGASSPADAQLSFSNPLLDFDSILCVARGYSGAEQHLCDQYFGCFATPGGSIYIISGFKNNQRKVTDLLQNATVQGGRYAGRKLSGGSFLSPELSYDGKTVVFAWKPASTAYRASWDQDQCFHLFKINIDGTGLVQLTDGKFNDFDPCYLPNGRIVFISERRGGFGRCHLRPVPTYTLFSMKDDGTDIIPLSYHETNEWHPSVDNNGMIVYSRWDYVDRDDCIAHHPWICYPDGRDPRSWHGNYPLPQTTMEGGNWPDGRNLRPWGEVNIRAIPNSQKYVATATGHHTQSFGELIIVDHNIRDDGMMSQVEGITTKRTTWRDEAGPWATAWPLSIDYYLASYNGDIVMIDKSANRLMICPKSATPVANNNNFRLIDPIPVKARPVPPDIAVMTYEGERESLPHDPARLSVMNVYETDLPFPQGTVIKWLRVIQLIPKATININEPRVSHASESVVRLALGVVPVESDGSAHFEAPVDRCLMFQVLDSNFMAVQSMRSLTYVHKGEHLTCLGCHEDKWKATPPINPIAMRREPSKLKPEFMEALPVSYYRTVKPVFDAKCAPCHKQRGRGPDMSYASLKDFVFHFCDGGWPYTNGNINVAEVGGSRTIPGKFGAKRSKLLPFCKPSHYDVSLTKDELHRITLWLDCNSNELGSEVNVSAQRSGQLVWPSIDVDPNNPLGVEDPTSTDEPSSAAVSPAAALVKPGSTLQFKATAQDILKRRVEPQPTFIWSVSGGGTITQTGLFTAGNSEGGPYTVKAEVSIDGTPKTFSATVIISSLSGNLLPAGKLTKLLCLQNNSTTCMPGNDTASVESRYVGTGKEAPLPDDQVQINGTNYKWTVQNSSDGVWFSNCGENRTSYSSISLINGQERQFKIAYTQDDHLSVWMNGRSVFSDRVWTSSEKLSPTITMPSGVVHLMIKQTNVGSAGSLSLRLVDNSGNDINDLLYFFEPTPTGLGQPANAAISLKGVPFSIQPVGGVLKIDAKCSQEHRVEIFNARGQRLASYSGSGNLHYSMPMKSVSAGILVARIVLDGKIYNQTIALKGSR
ncbi:MAG: hypothetical protein GX556_18600 [Fibrobacter sp.]|nr:hypothetical protein [Fibrobacter sp.]